MKAATIFDAAILLVGIILAILTGIDVIRNFRLGRKDIGYGCDFYCDGFFRNCVPKTPRLTGIQDCGCHGRYKMKKLGMSRIECLALLPCRLFCCISQAR